MKTVKHYNKLIHPTDSAWERKTWRKYAPIWFIYFWDGIKNIIRWVPTIYRDRDWDDYFITKMLQKKIEHQREYLIYHNRHMGLEVDNRDMTLVLNLIERKHEEYYALEKHDYHEQDMILTPVEGKTYLSELTFKTTWENLDAYLAKYPGSVRRVLKKYPDLDPNDKEKLSFYVGMYNQEKNDRLFWRIMAERSAGWWD